MTNTTERGTYQVAWPMIQIQGHAMPGYREDHLERTLRKGDRIPIWVPDEEVGRLLDGGFIEKVA